VTLKNFCVFIRSRLSKITLFTILVVTLSLRFIYLGYSDYISDEPGTFFYRGHGADADLSKWEFLLKQRKGPMQIFIGLIPHTIVGNYNNELAQRIPFAISGAAAIVVFYFLVLKITSNKFVAFVSSTLLSVNGLIVAYGRIAQYESLNLLFSFLALYFYADFSIKGANYLKSSLLGTFFFCLSFLTHWDAIYILIPSAVFFILFLKNASRSGIDSKYMVKIILANLFSVAILLLWFMIPYVSYQSKLPKSVEYLNSIVTLDNAFPTAQEIAQFKLYNPFFTYWFYLILGAVGTLVYKKSYIFLIWFAGVFLIMRFFIDYSGLHFYNILIPLVVLAAFGIDKLSKLSKYVKIPVIVATLFFLGFFYYQSYLLFVDHSVEYPMEREKIFGMKTPRITYEDELRHKTGFPLKRYWGDINDFVNEQNELRGESYGYTSNEYDSLTQFYMDTDRRECDGFYAIGVKRPLSLQMDYKFPQIKGKSTVHKIQNENGDTVVNIYRVEIK